jgi:adenylate kinase
MSYEFPIPINELRSTFLFPPSTNKRKPPKRLTYKYKIIMLNIVIFGAPGSGKGTQSENLIEHYKLFHISTGDVLRDHIKRGTELGKTAKGFIDQGQLIPDELMIGILAQVIDDNKKKAKKGVIFDGFPRTIPQAEALETLLNERGTSVSAVIGLEVPEQELIDRLVKRGQMSGRSDDNEETIKKRLDVYHNQTSPLQEFYKEKGLYKAIKGIGTIDGIFEDIKAAIDSLC